MSYKITPELEKVITKLEQSYTIDSRIYNTTVIRNAKGVALNAYIEIKGLEAKSKDAQIELKLEFYLQHEREKLHSLIKNVQIFPDTQENQEKVEKDLFLVRL